MTLSLFTNRSFLFLWLAQITATLGTELYNVAVIVTIFQGTGSVLQTTGVVVARMLPSLLFGQMAGAIVDRFPRRTVLYVVNLFRALVIGVMALLPSAVVALPWVGYGVVVALAIAEILYVPAQRALLPTLVEPAKIVSANSLIYTATPLTQGISRAVGVLILYWGFGAVIAIDLLLFLVGAGLIFAITQRESARLATATTLGATLFKDALEGLRYLRGHSLARALVMLEGLEFWPHGIWTSALMLVFTQRALHAGMEEWGWQGATFFLGQVIGSVTAIVATRSIERSPGWLIIANGFLMSLLTFVYATSSSLWVAIAVCFVFGPPSALRDVSQDALLQTNVSGDMLGRVYATKQMSNNLNFMLAGLLFGWLADYAPIRYVYLIGASLYFCAALYALSRQVLRQGSIRAVTLQGEVVGER